MFSLNLSKLNIYAKLETMVFETLNLARFFLDRDKQKCQEYFCCFSHVSVTLEI